MKRQYDDRIDLETQISTREVLVILRRALAYLWPARWLFVLKFFLMLGSFVPALVVTWPLKVLSDHVILGHSFDASSVQFPPFFQPFVDAVSGLDPSGLLIATLAVLMVLIIVFGVFGGSNEGQLAFMAQGEDTASQSENMISAGWSMTGGLWGLADLLCNIRLVQRVTNLLRTDLYSRLIRLPMHVLDDQRIGDSVYRTMYDAPAIQGVCFDISLMPAIALLGAFTSLYFLDYSFGASLPELVWLGIATMPLSLLLTIPLAPTARRASQESRSAGTATTNRMEENISQIAAVQSHGVGQREQRRFASASRESFRRFRRVVLVNIGIDTITVGGALAVMYLVVFLLVSEKIILGEFLPGDAIVLFGLFSTIAGTSITFGRLWIDLQHNVAGVRRVLFFLDQPIDQVKSGDKEFPANVDSIRFENVSFSYPNSTDTLVDISFEAKAGETIAMVGPTGAGKTTMAYMLARFLHPDDGQVSLNGQDLREFDINQVRSHITHVFQEHTLFSRSLLENVLLASPHAAEATIRHAFEVSGVETFLDELPDGVDTMLGPNGANLSVGQKQRLSIARALICDSPVLILDEPTAALDPRTEQAFLRTLNSSKSNRIVFVIAHRLSTIRSADQILFLDQGVIQESGTHEELMELKGRYHEYCLLQQPTT